MSRHRGQMMSALVVVLVGVAMTAAVRTRSPNVDRIEVVGHAVLSDGIVTQLLTATHWRRHYLYVEFANAPAIVVLDVTVPEKPVSFSRVTIADGKVRLTDVVGSVALATESFASRGIAEDRVAILDFTNPSSTAVVREFSHVTARLSDQSRNLVYLANDDGLWVLKKVPGDDVDALKRYDAYIQLNR